MTMICIKRADGGCSIGPMADGVDPENDVVKKWMTSARPEWLPLVSWRLIMPTDIEANTGGLNNPRTFRDAWVDNGMKVTHDMAKARIIKTDQVRKERNKRIIVEDIELMKAEESGDTGAATRIKVRKQALRDLPAAVQPDLSAIGTPEALEAYVPPWPA